MSKIAKIGRLKDSASLGSKYPTGENPQQPQWNCLDIFNQLLMYVMSVQNWMIPTKKKGLQLFSKFLQLMRIMLSSCTINSKLMVI
jgi:hypothetical protein